MTARELQEKGYLYRLDQDLKDQHRNAQRLTRLLEATPETEPQKRREIIRELFAEAPEDVCLE